MRYPASEKLEIIRLVERSQRPAKWTLDKLGVPRRTFYRWYDQYLHYGEDGTGDRAPHPGRVWNKIPDNVRKDVLDMALDTGPFLETRARPLVRFPRLPVLLQGYGYGYGYCCAARPRRQYRCG